MKSRIVVEDKTKRGGLKSRADPGMGVYPFILELRRQDDEFVANLSYRVSSNLA